MKSTTIIVRSVFLGLLILPILVSYGCRRSTVPEGLPKLVPCTITITQENVPLANATVSLSPPTKDWPWIGGGITDANGRVEIYTNGRYKGAPEGKFKIVILKSESEENKIPPKPSEDSPEYGQWMNRYQDVMPVFFSLIEKQYIDPSTTPLEIDISGSKPISATFDAGKKVRVKMD